MLHWYLCFCLQERSQFLIFPFCPLLNPKNLFVMCSFLLFLYYIWREKRCIWCLHAYSIWTFQLLWCCICVYLKWNQRKIKLLSLLLNKYVQHEINSAEICRDALRVWDLLIRDIKVMDAETINRFYDELLSFSKTFL